MTMGSTREFGRYLATIRRETGKSQRRVAELLCESTGRDTVTRHEVSRWERGKRVPTFWLPHLAAVLAVPLDRLEHVLAGSPPGPDTPPEPGPQITLSTLFPEEAVWPSRKIGRRVGIKAAEAICARAHRLRLADDVMASGDLVAPAARELRRAVRLFRVTTQSGEVERELLRAIGELAQIAGWITSDTGRHDEAERIYRLGLSAARAAQDGSLVSNLAGSLAYQHANTGRTEEAVVLARAALHEAGSEAHPTVRALALDRVAWAESQAHNPQPAIHALTKAHEALAEASSQVPPAWAYWVSHEELTVMDARVYTELQRPLKAVPLLSKILDRYDATHSRELVLYLSWLAVALADANEPEEAAATASHILDLSEGFPSERTAQRFRAVLAKLKPFRSAVPEVQAVFDRNTAAIASQHGQGPP